MHTGSIPRSLFSSPVKYVLVTLTLLLVAPGLAPAQKPADNSQLLIYNDITSGLSALDRDARKAYTGRFRVVEVTERDGFTPGRIKGVAVPFRDPRSMREAAVPGKIVYLFVVTADGRVIEPRILQSTDRRVSDYVLKSILVRRFVPARFRGVPVASLHSGDLDFGSQRTDENKLFQNGLGLQGYRDR
jgi:hypothetical protein